MATCHTQNIVPGSALQRELTKKEQQQNKEVVWGVGLGSGGGESRC